MLRKSLIFFIAFIGILSAAWAAKRAMTPPPKLPPKVEPSPKPYSNGIAATGIIEAMGENFSIGSSKDGIIESVFVNVWDRVQKGAPLFQIDSREQKAELEVAQAKEDVAEAQYQRIRDQLTRLRSVKDSRAISQEELRSKENEESVALATVRHMRKEKEKAAVLLERLTVRSPIDGIVLQKNIKPGEYIQASHTGAAPIILGDMRQFQIRADVDEHNASYMVEHASGIAYPKNRPGYSIPLTFVRIEPYVIPKVSLTGSSKEKVDTRVLQVIYSFEPPKDFHLYIGQQVDVYIERKPSQNSLTVQVP